MRRIAIEQPESQGQDSFLDIVANMVGILILLVMVVGVRAARLPAAALFDEQQASPADAPEPAAESNSSKPPDELPAKIVELQSEIAELAQRVAANVQEEKLREAERVQLAAHALAVERELERRKAKLDDVQRRDHETVEHLSAARRRLDELAEAQMALTAAPASVERIENLPTPLAQTVRGEELHLRLKGGMVSVIPLDELVSGLEDHARDNAWKLAGDSVLEETLGPVGGYRLRYRLVRQRIVVQSAAGPINQGNVVQLEGWELLPMADDLGQPVEQALLQGSELRRVLAGKRPATTTVTAWVYPDSFNEFRRLKKALFEMGFATAARPLPRGQRIGGSPRGSKSAAQ